MFKFLRKTLMTALFSAFASQASAMFIQPDWLDPTAPGVGTNRYAYSFNDPINNVDTNGNWCVPCAVPVIEVVKWVGVAVITGIGIGVTADQMSEDGTEASNNSGAPPQSLTSERRIGELQEIDAPGHNAPRPELEGLSDEDLIDSIFNPGDGQGVKVKGNRILDGNGRIKEAKRRGLLGDDDYIPVDEIPEDDDMAPWEKDEPPQREDDSSEDKQDD